MPSIPNKIEANAAQRLVRKSDDEPPVTLARYQNFLKLESHRLRMQHRAGASGLEICHARSDSLDIMVRQLFQDVLDSNPPPPKSISKLALVAYGGYGRRELNPFSDIDVMILHDGEGVTRAKPHQWLREVSEVFYRTLWDVNLDVGGSVRNIEDCVQVANEDMKTKSSLIQTRLIMGDEKLYERMQHTYLARCVQGYDSKYIQERLDDQIARRTRFGDSPFMQEPNIKNGCGGLRDYQNLLWMTFFKKRCRTLEELEEHGFITAIEFRDLSRAYDFLHRVRNELHYLKSRGEDTLYKSLQPQVASHLGFTDRSPSKRLEALMQHVFLHMRHIYLLSTVVEDRLALQPKRTPLAALAKMLTGKSKPIEIDGFLIKGDRLEASTSRILRDQPRRLVRVFLHMQQRGLHLHPDLAQAIRNQVRLIDRKFRYDKHVHESFLEILNQPGNVSRVVRRMHELQVLGKYFPEFGRLTCLVQHEFFHQYTADEHTLVCLEKLDEVWESNDPLIAPYATLLHQLENPYLLYLALLLHDTGKAVRKGRHEKSGKQIAKRVAQRLGLNKPAIAALGILVEYHVLMAMISQRRDLDDPEVIRAFADVIKSRQLLDMLTLLTLCDSRATSDKLWNGFKDALLWSLYHKTRDLMSGGTEYIMAAAKEREDMLAIVRRSLPPAVADDEVQAHFECLPPRYFQSHSVPEIVEDLLQVHQFMHLQVDTARRALEPILTWHQERDRGYSVLNICTWDRPAVFTKFAGALTIAGLNILGAKIYSRTDGVLLDTFYVIDAATGRLVRRPRREKFAATINDILVDHADVDALFDKVPKAPALYQALQYEPLPHKVTFDNDTSETRTVIDVETSDRIGLLYILSQRLTEMNIEISLAKICTEKGAAFDTFYVSDEDGNKILDTGKQQWIADNLTAALEQADE